MRRARDPNCDRSGGESPTSGSTSEKFDAVTTGGESHWGPNEVREVTAAENTQTGFAPLHELDLASRPLLNPPSVSLTSALVEKQSNPPSLPAPNQSGCVSLVASPAIHGGASPDV